MYPWLLYIILNHICYNVIYIYIYYINHNSIIFKILAIVFTFVFNTETSMVHIIIIFKTNALAISGP